MDKFLRLKIKTKLTFGIGLLFTMIVLLGGLAVQNITDMSSDTQNILADNYNSLLYSRRMLDALERIKNCLLYTSPSPRDPKTSRMPSSA